MSADSSRPERYLPIGLDLRGKSCRVVGGGSVGTRKATTLAQAGAAVTVVAPTITPTLQEAIEAGRMRWRADSFSEEQLDGVFLAIAATDDDSVNAQVVRLSVARSLLVCDASSAGRSQVIFGALLHRDDVTVAVFTDGRDPTLARQTRDRIADLMDRH